MAASVTIYDGREGTHIVRVTDHAPEVLLESSADFHGDSDGGARYGRDSRGALVSDSGRGILAAEYSAAGSPLCIGMEGGYAFRYVYDSEGRRLRSSLTGPGKGFIGWEPIPDIRLPLTADGAADGTTAGDVKLPARLLASRSRIGSIELDGDTIARLLTPWGWLTAKDGVFHSAVADRRGDIRAVASPMLRLGHVVIGGDSIRGRSAPLSGGLSEAMQRIPTFKIGAESYFLEQANFYYPFGLPAAIGWGADANTRKFGGKELELRRGLGLYDFGARLYDPALAAFTSPDPLARDFPSADPYTYCGSNPVSFWDPSGMKIECAGNDPEKEKAILDQMHEFADDSSAFSVVFDYLDELDTTFYISWGETSISNKGIDFVENAAGEYNTRLHTLTFNKNSELPAYITVAEETYHALQLSTPLGKILHNNENIEFEAKTFATIAASQKGIFAEIDYIADFQKLILNNVGNKKEPFTREQYISAGRIFQSGYSNPGGLNRSSQNEYSKPVTKVPSLLQIILKISNLIERAKQN